MFFNRRDKSRETTLKTQRNSDSKSNEDTLNNFDMLDQLDETYREDNFNIFNDIY